MKLSQLAEDLAEGQTTTDPQIAGLAVDSRETSAGFLFAALAGSRAAGARFVVGDVAMGEVRIRP